MFIGEGVKNIHAWWIRMRRICWRCVCGYLTYVTFFRMSASSVRITGPPSRVLFTSRTPSTAEQCQGKKSVQNMFVFVNLNCRNSRLGLFNLTLKWPTFAQARLRLLNFNPSTDIYDLPPEVYLWFVIFFQI